MPAKRLASPGLEAFVDEAIRLSKERGYNPTIFVGMRHQHGTIDAVERLVQSGELQSGFKRLKQLGLLDWTIESAVLKFAAEFSNNAKQCAEWRLKQVRPDGKDSKDPSRAGLETDRAKPGTHTNPSFDILTKSVKFVK
jgi:hypothetical protein